MSHLKATPDQIKISNDLEQQLMQSQNTKFRMDETAFGTEHHSSTNGLLTDNNYMRNASAVFQPDTVSAG